MTSIEHCVSFIGHLSLSFQKHIFKPEQQHPSSNNDFSVTRGYWPNNGTEGLASRRTVNNIQHTHTHTHKHTHTHTHKHTHTHTHPHPHPHPHPHTHTPRWHNTAPGAHSFLFSIWQPFKSAPFIWFIWGHTLQFFHSVLLSSFFNHFCRLSFSFSPPPPPLPSAPQPPSWTVTLYNHLGTYAAAISFLQASLKLKYTICSDRAMTGE